MIGARSDRAISIGKIAHIFKTGQTNDGKNVCILLNIISWHSYYSAVSPL